jgi:tetratricopeptide (TPR) repeat protein
MKKYKFQTKMNRKDFFRIQNKTVLLLFMVLFTAILPGQNNPKELFEQANEMYRTNSYKKAIELYDSIEGQGMVSSELYFNLGNSYYKLNQIAESIYNYEKALQLNPQNKDAKVNLVYAKRMTIDAIEELPKTVLQNFEADYLQELSYNQWAWLSVVASLGLLLFFMGYYFSYVPSQKRIYFAALVACILLLLSSFIISFKEHQYETNKLEAIVFQQVVAVKNAPSENSEEVFELHEGTKVNVLDKVAAWKKIKLADGKVGWIPKEALREL